MSELKTTTNNAELKRGILFLINAHLTLEGGIHFLINEHLSLFCFFVFFFNG